MIDETRFKETTVAETTETSRPRSVSAVTPRFETTSTTEVDQTPIVIKRASWGAIVAGLVCAMAIQTLLYVLGAAIGLSVISPATANSDTLQGLGIGAGIWLVLSTIIGLFIGGWVAGRLAGMPRGLDGMLHGVAVWATGLVLSALLAVAFGSAALGGALTTMGLDANRGGNNPQAPQQSAVSVDRDRTEQRAGSQGVDRYDAQRQTEIVQDVARENEQAREFVRQRLTSLNTSADVDPNDLRKDDSLINDVAAAIVPGAARDAHEQAVESLADNAKMDQSQAQRTIDQWKGDFAAQASRVGSSSATDRQQARQAAEKTREGAATGAWWAFFALLLGLGAAGFGGYLGTPRDIVDVSISDYTTARRSYRPRTCE